jgi:hypothetical protein
MKVVGFALAAAWAFGAASVCAAADGVLVVERTTSATGVRTSQVQIEKSRMRADVSSIGGAGSVVLFDGVQQVLRTLDSEKKTYREMTKADADSVGTQMNDMAAMIRAQLEKMPPAQRAQMEAMMQGRGGPGAMGGAVEKTEYRKAGSDKVGKWSCDKYEGYRGERKTVELCTVTPQALGFTAADFDVSRELSEFFSKLVPQAGDNVFQMGKGEEHGFSGLPVRRISFGSDGKPTTTTEITDVSRQRFADALFAVPADFQKVDLPMMGPGGRGGRGAGRGRGRE